MSGDDGEMLEALAAGSTVGPRDSAAIRIDSLADLATTDTLAGRLFHAAPLPWIIVDGSGRIVRANARVEVDLGWPVQDLEGQLVDVLVPEQFRAVHEHHRRGWMEHPRTRPMGSGLEVRMLRRDGSERHAEVQLSALELPDGRYVGAIVQDVAERKERERHLREIHDALQQAHAEVRAHADQLRRANEHKNRVLGMVAHDLRTPLAVVHSYADLLAMLTSGAEGQSKLQDVAVRIQRATKQMRLLLDDLLDLTVIESGTLSLRLAQTDVATLLHEVVGDQAPLAVGRRMTLKAREPATLPPVRLDRHRIVQVLQNLVSNALKYAPEGTDIEISAEGDGDHVVLRVRDEGSGIEPALAKRLFEPFATGDIAARGNEKSIGLGLAIVKRIVEEHEGRVEVESAPGHGATFAVYLPTAGPRAQPVSGV